MTSIITILGKIITNVLTALYQPFGFSILLSFFILFFYLYAYCPENAGKGWKTAIKQWFTTFKASLLFRKLFLLAFVTSLILFRTLLNRNLWMNPLSNVMGGWSLWVTAADGTRTLTTECIENMIMMVPFTGVLLWTIGNKLLGGRKDFKSIVRKSAAIVFCFSLGIEFSQLFLRVGTFQLSDLFYNTLGGALGGMFYWAWVKRSSPL